MVFRRKNKWPEHHFSIRCSGSSWKMLIANQFLVSIIFFTYKNIYFFNLRSNLFRIKAKNVKQIRSKVICIAARHSCTHYGPLQRFSTYFAKPKEIGVLRPLFSGHVISCDYDYTCIFATFLFCLIRSQCFSVRAISMGTRHCILQWSYWSVLSNISFNIWNKKLKKTL